MAASLTTRPPQKHFIFARLASTGRWLVLVPNQYDFGPPEIHALMSGATLESETLVANI
jgi:hypothetical protein